MNFPARRQPLRQPSGRVHPFQDTALGLVSTKSFPAIVGTADMMLKSAAVTLVGYEKTGGGYCTAVVRGKTADVRLAVEEGARTAAQFDQYVSKLVIPRPLPNLEAIFPIGSHLAEIAQQQQGYSRLSNRSIGLLETRGFPAMVGAADAMLKSADVQLASYETIGDGLCTAIIRGTVSNVAMAIDAGMHEAERIGELHAVMIIPRLLEDLEHTLPVAEYWLDKATPMPDLVKEKVPQRIALPELEPVSIPLVLEAEPDLEKAVEVEIVEPFDPGQGY
ncbi:carbon dioxide concentrating mechanism protein [[Synechococcus] sp. NIES-970]|uniref:BMC domain-containing protein n=1 Tax=Picosynechococcus sp. NKBG15041c TaxID=1407650 RepID=UPI0004288C9C|nr:carbon dioxide-concentrating mechanism protein [Picosynechococcus sp. NKBG15041c]BAW97526.1 carbon dioxide concentrating mechanism protein [[Synechococcus] sp. NIES-970]